METIMWILDSCDVGEQNKENKAKQTSSVAFSLQANCTNQRPPRQTKLVPTFGG
jgi:hypothetical protein